MEGTRLYDSLGGESSAVELHPLDEHDGFTCLNLPLGVQDVRVAFDAPPVHCLTCAKEEEHEGRHAGLQVMRTDEVAMESSAVEQGLTFDCCEEVPTLGPLAVAKQLEGCTLQRLACPVDWHPLALTAGPLSIATQPGGTEQLRVACPTREHPLVLTVRPLAVARQVGETVQRFACPVDEHP